MVKVISVQDVSQLIHKHTLKHFLLDLITQLEEDFVRWHEFNKIPRPAFHVPDGVIELMPTADNKLFACKYVNGHPNNPLQNKQTIFATGQLSKVSTGEPILVSEMTLLTGLRTAATSALAINHLARKNSKVLTLIGTGSQSDFQALATALVRDIKVIKYYDIDPKAMLRFERNMKDYNFELIKCKNAKEAVEGSDIITVCTADKRNSTVVMDDWIKDGMHINAIGGDCPGKTELDSNILKRSKVVVEFFEQSFIEGEIQFFTEEEAKKIVHSELWENISNKKEGRISNNEITVFDSVGFALEDFSALVLTHNLVKKYSVGIELDMIPNLTDPKDLFSILNQVTNKNSLKI